MRAFTSLALAVASAALTFATPAAALGPGTAAIENGNVVISGTNASDSIAVRMETATDVYADVDTAGAGCTGGGATGVTCPLGSGSILVATGGGDDVVLGGFLANAPFPVGKFGAALGDGNDTFTGSVGDEYVEGGNGNDKIDAEGGNNTLKGGPGNDELKARGGADSLYGEAGNDSLDADNDSNVGVSKDLIDGGEGFDTGAGWYPATSTPDIVNITVDSGADDGRPGEGDDVRSIERILAVSNGTVTMTDADDEVIVYGSASNPTTTVFGRGGKDTLTGNVDRETLDGGAGDDAISGGFNDDVIVGGPGRDALHGDLNSGQCGFYQSCTVPFGNDTIRANDGEVDSITCGPGTDTVVADGADVVAPDCENVQRTGSAADTAGPGNGVKLTVATTARFKVARAGLRAVVTGVAAGTLVRVEAKSGSAVVLRASGRANTAGKVTLRLKLTAKGRALLAKRASVKLRVSGPGLPTKRTMLVR